jgi:hypothetical protein
MEDCLQSNIGTYCEPTRVCSVLRRGYLCSLQALERRADKQIARQEDALVRAVVRVWKAHERGLLLGRLQNARLLKQAWEAWKKRLRHQGELEGLTIGFIVFYVLTYSLACSCRTRLYSALANPCHILSRSSLAPAAFYATGCPRFCSTICQCTATIPPSLQMAHTITRTFKAVTRSQDR